MVKINKKIWFSLSLGLLFSLSLAMSAFAGGSASLYLSPPSGTYAVDSTFSVKVKVNSGGEAINAAEGTLIFNPDELQVVSLSKSGSIFSLWTTEPTFSNFTGEIAFGGGTPTGFTGTSGTIITITFKAKSVGSSDVNFSSGSVLAADGKGTNILSSMDSGSYIIKPKIILPPVKEYVPSENTPSAPIISSRTHPDLERWYSDNDPEFAWEVSEDVTGVRLLVDHSPLSTPTVFYLEPISEKKLEDLDDGIWYFHCQLQNKFGWGWASHFKFQIDTTLLEPPTIIEYPKELISGSPLLIKGTSLPEVRVQLFIQKEGEIETGQTQSDNEGKWFYIHDRILEKGIYNIWAAAIDLKGAKSNPSEKIVISVTPPVFIRIGEVIIDYLSFTIIILVLTAAVIFEFLWIFKKIKQTRRKLEKETTEAEKALYRAFKTLRKEMKERVAELDGKPGLSEREKKMLDGFKKTLKNSEKLIEKEIKDIEKELE